MNLTDQQKKLISWIIIAVVTIAVSTFLGVNFPIPPVPVIDEQPLTISHFTDLPTDDADVIAPAYTAYTLDTSDAGTITLAVSAKSDKLIILINDTIYHITIDH